MGAAKKAGKIKRSKGFWGLHYDLHVREDWPGIGENVTREMVENIIKKVKPDYIHIDCKGHPGLASYPTKVGYRPSSFVKDPLKIWREVTEEYGVALVMHYSGVVDTEAVIQNPSWGQVNDSFNVRNYKATSTFGPYVDKLMIPQLKELCDVYRVDSVWVDGDSWAVRPDFHPAVLEAFRRKTGIEKIPEDTNTLEYGEFVTFCRDNFRKYLKHYVDEMHAHNPDFEICSNWAYGANMPEPVTVNVDYLSGDLAVQDAVKTARFSGRCVQRQGKSWDFMSYTHVFKREVSNGSFTLKSAVQLQQEAAMILSLGGGYALYLKQKKDCSVYNWHLGFCSEVAEFCRKRQSVCQNIKPIPQIGLIYSGQALYHRSGQIFGSFKGLFLRPLRGVLDCLVESQNVVEILMEHQVSGRMSEYPLLVVPEWDYLEEDFKKELLCYVQDGGNLLLIGPGPAALFKEELGVVFTGDVQEKVWWLEQGGRISGMRSAMQKIELKQGTSLFGRIFNSQESYDQRSYDEGRDYYPAASIKNLGKGKIAAIYFNIGDNYFTNASCFVRKYLNTVVRELFPDPIVEVKGSGYVDVILTQKDGNLAVQLVNTSGPHNDPNVLEFDEITPLGPLSVSIRTARKPVKVMQQPENTEIPFQYLNGKVELAIPRLEIHSAIIMEMKSVY
ncbi:MAG: hypothetical protein FWC45_04535 [Treponema sp.]|nr:hypothetical protein [Treponema sp.]